MSSAPPLSSVSVAHLLENQRRAATARGRQQIGGFAVEGLRLVRRGVRAGSKPLQLLLGKSIAEQSEGLQLQQAVPEARVVADELLLTISQGRNSGLYQALFETPKAHTLDEVVKKHANALFLVLLEVEEPGNVGALIRTALASGVEAVVYAGGTDPFHPKAVRTSLGSLFRMPLIDVGLRSSAGSASEACLEALHAAGIHSLATSPRGGEDLLKLTIATGPVALILGNEGQGLSAEVQALARQKLSISQSEQADSYSVNAAAAICLFEMGRRRRLWV